MSDTANTNGGETNTTAKPPVRVKIGRAKGRRAGIMATLGGIGDSAPVPCRDMIGGEHRQRTIVAYCRGEDLNCGAALFR